MIRTKVYRSFGKTPTAAQRIAGEKELRTALAAYPYAGQSLPAKLSLSADRPAIDYFEQFPGLDAGARYNGDGFWSLSIPVSTAVTVDPNDVVIYDDEGYQSLRNFLKGMASGTSYSPGTRRTCACAGRQPGTRTCPQTSTRFSSATRRWRRARRTPPRGSLPTRTSRTRR